MSSPGHGLAPGAIAAIVIGTLFVLVGLSAAGIILHYRRRPVTCDSPSSMEKPAPLSKTPQRRMRRPPSRKPTPRLFINEISFPMPLARKGRDRKRDYENSPVSTLDMVISPSLPRIFKLSAEGGESAAVEVRVTPPTPIASRAELGVPSPTKLKPNVKARFQTSSGVGLGMLPMGNESTRLVT
ncbi:hypothetical protein FOMPIDRAFT_86435 [Fomitopsis schrenkii]|uniref:Uncharacterized protein n=1 Tax=Fomitopsis schrenkii TaxID=2126942 RepID=S8DPR4_FOMSC|nr:hypothetical protein FOMPIDRAFT_86435 [Fomitopsis schrenkii]